VQRTGASKPVKLVAVVTGITEGTNTQAPLRMTDRPVPLTHQFID
jgi:hypothetical protein